MTSKNNLPALLILSEVDSSNNYATGLIHAGLAQHGTAVLALHQTAGKGQRGRQWTSPPGEGLNLSLVLQPDFLPPSEGFQLLATTAVAVAQVLGEYTSGDCRIKWPNDLYWRDRKAGGILLENQVQGRQWKWCVAGIGINVLQTTFPVFLSNPVSLLQITGKRIDVQELALAIQQAVWQAVWQLQQHGFAPVLQRYNQLLFAKDQEVRLEMAGQPLRALVQAVDETGRLVTQINGEQRWFEFGSITWCL